MKDATSALCAGSSREGMAECGCLLPWLPLSRKCGRHVSSVASCKAPAQEGKWLLGERKGRLKFDASLEAISDQAQQ